MNKQSFTTVNFIVDKLNKAWPGSGFTSEIVVAYLESVRNNFTFQQQDFIEDLIDEYENNC
jgi:hypothetical protein